MTIKAYKLIGITTLLLFKSNVINSQTDSTKLYFQQSFNELKSMLEGKQPMSFERAVFLSENPYWDNKYAYQDFKDVITYESNKIQKLIILNNKSDSTDFSVKIDFNAKKHNINNLKYTEQEKREMYRKTLSNWAIFKFITDTTNFYNVIHYPFTYQLDDPFGANDWKHSQTMNLFISDEKKGNCLALATLFKLYADRLNTNAYLCTAPQHIYIQHKDNKGDFYNVELATGTHPGDGSIKTLTYTDIEAIANGIALRRLTKPNEYLSLCLINLAKAYEHKLNSKDDNFILQCSELALKHDSLNLNAMLLNAQVLEERVLKYANKQKVSDLNKLRLDKNLSATFKKLEMQLADLNRLGYHQMPLYMQEMILAGLKRKENERIIVQDKTPNPFPSLKDVAPEDKRYSTLSKGVFEEVHEKKPVEQYGRFKLNVKNKKIVQIVDTSNFQFLIDPVVFAWQIDPLAAKFPHYSPYVAFGDNPIFYVDEDGQEITPSAAFRNSTYGEVHNYLIKNNSGYKELIGKYQNSKVFNLKLGTDDSKIRDGKGGRTDYKYNWATSATSPKLKVTTSANSEENFRSSTGKEAATLYHFYILIHEGAHSAEALNPSLAEKSKNHNALAAQTNVLEKAFKQLSDNLDLGLSQKHIMEISLYGSEDSDKYKNYINGLVKTNKTTFEAEDQAFKNRVQDLLNLEVEVPKEKTTK